MDEEVSVNEIKTDWSPRGPTDCARLRALRVTLGVTTGSLLDDDGVGRRDGTFIDCSVLAIK